MSNSFFSDSQQRIAYTKEWLDKFTNISILNKKPEIAITGISNETLNNVKLYGDYAGCMIYSYLEDPNRFNNSSNKRIVVAACLIAKDEEEYSQYKERLMSDSNNNLHLTLFGYESDIIERIIKLKETIIK